MARVTLALVSALLGLGILATWAPGQTPPPAAQGNAAATRTEAANTAGNSTNASSAPADSAPTASAPGKSVSSGTPELPAFTPEREAAALAFVAEHHAELNEVLAQLKGVNRGEYESAIGELYQTREKLALFQSMDEPLYRLMLESWKIDSQIKLLAARSAFAGKPAASLEEELKRLLYRQVDLQRLQVEHNRQKALAAVANMEANIKWLSDKREELVERRFQNLLQACRKMVNAGPKPPATDQAPAPPPEPAVNHPKP